MASQALNAYPEISEQDYVYIRTNFQTHLEDLKSDLQQLKIDFVKHTGQLNICFSDPHSTCGSQCKPGRTCSYENDECQRVQCDRRKVIEKEAPASQLSQDEVVYLHKFRTSEEICRYIDQCHELKHQIEWVEEVLRNIEFQLPILAALIKIKRDRLGSEEENIKNHVENLSEFLDESRRVDVGKQLNNSKISRPPTTIQRTKSDLQCKLEEEYYCIMIRIADIVRKNTSNNVPRKCLQRIEKIVASLPGDPVSSVDEHLNKGSCLGSASAKGNESDANN